MRASRFECEQPQIVQSSSSPILTDEAFATHMNQLVLQRGGKWFHAKIAGVSHLNDDGSSRQVLLRRLKPLDILKLVPEPTNSYDQNAVKVVTGAGEQVGYLERRLAGEVTRSLKRGDGWLAVVAHLNRAEGAPTLGITIGMLHLTTSSEYKRNLQSIDRSSTSER